MTLSCELSSVPTNDSRRTLTAVILLHGEDLLHSKKPKKFHVTSLKDARSLRNGADINRKSSLRN